MCVKTRQGLASPHGQAFCSSAKLTAWSFLPGPAKESIQGFKALMALTVRERKDMSTVGITRIPAPVCVEVMLSAGMDRGCGIREPGVGCLGGIISCMIQGQ